LTIIVKKIKKKEVVHQMVEVVLDLSESDLRVIKEIIENEHPTIHYIKSGSWVSDKIKVDVRITLKKRVG
jgi:predicted transcriptional regulator